ncbi:DEAD/DEAH box helicase family protein [Gluconacetobacter sp. 1b LMG 1731]|uniref:DEAD/DEAH box helicase family protein n=1 Tax=Gluconacetobacter dulcium TaxID=2729096 RepID=A0A7W4IKH2_9PROT|nr:DEAD/DEAH box helicase family protein [Gluconacetobacter dulcium]MBB2164558.1 DEAD/DEAH box helicase family protein [Gluconacetobacter dulcium]MBB2193675.1 DEAD/DEAH box helicase family protein [Gluconacetobacter dulcium]
MADFGTQFSLFDSTPLSGKDTCLYWGDLEGEDADAAPAAFAKALAEAPAVVPQRDFRLAGLRGLAAGWQARARDNLAAIRLLGELERDERNATAAEQAILSRFVGFGAGDLANNLFPRAGDTVGRGWEEIGAELTACTSETERAALARAVQYAHYTPEYIVHTIWDFLLARGFQGGSVLEPGCGTGLFIATRPAKLDGSIAFTGIEMDAVTARIAGCLYPRQWIRQEDFTKAKLDSGYDLAIGNPPFSNRTVHNADDRALWGFSLHDYFIARSIEALRPGGIAAFVTSRHTLDKSSTTARAHMQGMADLLGAVRLPATAMRADAGTDVVVDVLVFRRRAIGELPGDDHWLESAEIPDTDLGQGALHVNRYYLDHGEQVLGRHAWTTSQFGPDYTCEPIAGVALDEALPIALGRIAPDVRFPAPTDGRIVAPAADGRQIGTAADGADLKEGSYFLEGGVLHQIVAGRSSRVLIRKGEQKEGLFQKHARIIEALVPVRDAARRVLRAQMENQPFAKGQGDLKRAYQAFVRQFGPINLTKTTVRVNETTGVETETQRRPNLQPFYDDPDVWLVSSIEEYDEATERGRPGPLFTDRVIHAPVEPEIHSAHDALAVSLHDTGRVDIPLIAELLGRSESDVVTDLGSAIFLDPAFTFPGRDSYVTADAYLSGPVRTKLAKAREAASHDGRFTCNVTALEGVQPEDLRPSDITARLGAPWLPVSDVTDFVREVLGVETRIHHTAQVACWSVDKLPFAGKAEATSVWGTERRHAGELLEDALTQASPKIYDTWTDQDGEHRVLNTQETEAAKEKLAAIRSAFSTWVWQDAERADRLVRLYNDTYNNLVARKFDGAHLRLPGASTTIRLREHQKRVIWRIIATGGTYIAHAVGSGKTFSMCAAVMEQRRLGLISKAMIVVPGHCLAQMAREFLMLYPTAKILVADETNFVKEKRQRFLARAATGNWDAIIITHDAFKFIPVEAAFEREMIEAQIASYEELLDQVDGEDRLSRKRIERMKEGMEAKLEGLAARKDDLVHLGEIGIDQILVDEAQQFRKLSFATNQSDLKGIDPNGSQRAWDLFVKTRYLAARNPERPLILASGSPITNTLGELYTVQRYMALESLQERYLHEFDPWAANFGETRTELELQPSGLYKPVTRFTEFVNVADLMAMYLHFADVVQQEDLRRYVKLPAIQGGHREIVVAPANDDFRAYQKVLAERIRVIENRKARPQKGDDILLSVINDARHAAIDLRFVERDPANENAPSKLDVMIRNVFRIWQETSENRYTNPETGGPYDLPGAVQMVFSDLGTVAAEGKRGFSAYLWMRDELVRMGVPRDQIAFMQDYKKAAAKLRLFGDLNSGRKRILIGSTATMGTGVNAQQRLIALHHLDVPWLVSDIIQREGRIERQGNQNPLIHIYAYAQEGSVDATNWQLLERKLRFISLAMSGDRSIRRIEDVNDDGNQFAMAKALASGDARLMQKAGLEAELARLERLHAAHYDDQFAVRRAIQAGERDIARANELLPKIEADIARREPTRGDAFRFEAPRGAMAERERAGAFLLGQARMAEKQGEEGRWVLGRIGGFDIVLEAWVQRFRLDEKRKVEATLAIDFSHGIAGVEFDADTKPLGVVSKIEHALLRLDSTHAETLRSRADAEGRLPAYRARLDVPFREQALLDDKRNALAELEAELAATASPGGNDNEAGPVNNAAAGDSAAAA